MHGCTCPARLRSIAVPALLGLPSTPVLACPPLLYWPCWPALHPGTGPAGLSSAPVLALLACPPPRYWACWPTLHPLYWPCRPALDLCTGPAGLPSTPPLALGSHRLLTLVQRPALYQLTYPPPCLALLTYPCTGPAVNYLILSNIN